MTCIIKKKYKDNHVKLELDNGQVLKIPVGLDGTYRLDVGREIDNTEYVQLNEESQRFLCREKSLNYLAIRARSTLEMESYLNRKGFSADIIREIISALKESGYINDFDFALMYIGDRLNRKLIGSRLLKSELQKKGIARKIIDRALKESGAGNVDIDKVYEIAEKKYNSLKDKKNSINKLALFLQRKGFEYAVVEVVLDRIKNISDN